MDLLYEPETSGGLIYAINSAESEMLLNDMIENGIEAFIIGEMIEKGDKTIYIK